MQNSLSNIVAILWEKINDYLKTKIRLLKLEAVEKYSGIAAGILSRLFLFITLLMFFFMLTIGVALWLGSLLGKLYYGFFIVAGFYLVIGLVFFVFRKKLLKKPIRNILIKEILN